MPGLAASGDLRDVVPPPPLTLALTLTLTVALALALTLTLTLSLTVTRIQSRTRALALALTRTLPTALRYEDDAGEARPWVGTMLEKHNRKKAARAMSKCPLRTVPTARSLRVPGHSERAWQLWQLWAARYFHRASPPAVGSQQNGVTTARASRLQALGLRGRPRFTLR